MTKRKPRPELKRQPADDAHRAAVEACQLLGFGDNPSRLCPGDRLKVDLVSTLRLVIDHAGEVVLAGGTADLGKLVTAVEHLTALLPQKRLPKAVERDPREIMLAELQRMSRIGALGGEDGYEGFKLQCEALRAENAALRARLEGRSPDSVKLASPDAVTALTNSRLRRGETVITPTEVVPPSEIAENDPDPRPGPDDHRVREPVTIEGEAVRVRTGTATAQPRTPPRAASAKPFVNGLSDVPAHVRDSRPANEPWREFACDTDGMPLSGRRNWGPV